jgi:hypothetical protein
MEQRLMVREGGYDDLEGELPFCRDDIKPLPAGEARYQEFADLVKRHGSALYAYDNADGCLFLDVQTANLLVQVADALNPTNRSKFLVMDLGQMVTLAWKLIS